jgi:vacuolar-type H+-ATPase subunit I/STV1
MSDSPANAPPLSGNVIVSAERLAELERYEQMILKKKEKDKERFKELKQTYSDDPEKSKQRVMKHYELHKDEINAKRREKRRLEREAKEAAKKSETPGV